MTTLQRTALVTGASQGLGRSIAIQLGASGCRVAVNYFSSKAAADETVDEIRASGGIAHAFRADVRSPEEVQRLTMDVTGTFGPPEIVVHNATGPQPMMPLENYSWADFQSQLDFFVKAPVLLTQSTLASMKNARWGRIILIGSEVVDLGNANFSAYVAAKSAMVGLMRSWATELGPYQITVNLVAPGWIPVARHADADQNALKSYAAGVPLGRQGLPTDVAKAVAYLAGDGAAFVTGQALAVNGGNTF